MDNIDKYLLRKQEDVLNKINEDFISIENIVTKHILPYIANKKDNNYAKFHKYYLEVLQNTDNINLNKVPNDFNDNNFFLKFKTNYSLQGISKDYLDHLTQNKENIIELINKGNINDLFFDYFAKAEIDHKGIPKTRELSSFFSKLLHTFKPNEYCALDNPIKDYFGLKRESFLIAFFCINNAYEKWISESNKISILREEIRLIDIGNDLKLDSLSDKKILDMVYWHKANIKIDKNTEG